MNKVIFRSLIATIVILLCFMVYLGSTEVAINPKLIKKELIINDS